MNGTHKDINLCSSMFRQESSAGIGHSYSPLALACNGMLPLFSAPSQVLQIHCLQSRLMYICSALKTRSNNSLLALVYLPLPHRRTVCLYIWQHVHTNSGPTFTLDWKLAIQFPIRTTDALFFGHAGSILFLSMQGFNWSFQCTWYLFSHNHGIMDDCQTNPERESWANRLLLYIRVQNGSIT